jgi:hypothetical protein
VPIELKCDEGKERFDEKLGRIKQGIGMLDMWRVATFLIGCVSFGVTHSALSASPWVVDTSDDGTVIASLTLDHVSHKDPNVIAVLTVGFGRKNVCHAEIGTALLSNGYGHPIRRVDASKTDLMVMRIDSNSEWQVHPFLMKYDNGWEALFNATDALLAQLRSGSLAYSRIIPEAPTIEFPLAGADSAIGEAQATCLSRLRRG